MKYRRLGKKGPEVSAIGLGCMVLSAGHYGEGSETEVALRLMQEAFDGGITFFDTADMYSKGENEKLVAKGIKPFRDKIILASKCALEYIPNGIKINNQPEYIKACCEASLKRLEVDHIDLYYLHRYNPEVPIETSMGTMLKLINEGKIRFVGLSEAPPEIMRRAHAVLGDKLIALQSEYSIMNRDSAEKVLKTTRELGMAFVAFSPLTRGLVSGAIREQQTADPSGPSDFRHSLPQFQGEHLKQNLRLVDALQAFAEQKRATPAQIALAWLLAQGDDIIPIPGTKRLSYLKENIAAVNIQLTPEDLATLDGIMQENPIAGDRYPEAMSHFKWENSHLI